MISSSVNSSVRSSIAALLPLHSDPRLALSTGEAAAHLGRKPQTLRAWACNESGPLRPIRVNGRLAWPVADIKRLLGIA